MSEIELTTGKRYWAIMHNTGAGPWYCDYTEPWEGEIWQQQRAGGLYTALISGENVSSLSSTAGRQHLTIHHGNDSGVYVTFEEAVSAWEYHTRRLALEAIREAVLTLEGLPDRVQRIRNRHAAK